MAQTRRNILLSLIGITVAGGLLYVSLRPEPIPVDLHSIERGTLTIRHLPERNELLCEIDLPGSHRLIRLVDRVRRLFDLNADPLEIERCLRRDDQLADAVQRRPGLRVPGAWDPFEIAVRAVVGQQISLRAATSVMGKIAQRFGVFADGRRYFPAPQSLTEAQEGDLPMPRARAAAVRALSRQVLDGTVDFGAGDPSVLVEQLMHIKGIGPWTAQYVAMRAADDPDAFLHGDLVLLRVARDRLGVCSAAELRRRAEAWRPWRAYAAMHLWSTPTATTASRSRIAGRTTGDSR